MAVSYHVAYQPPHLHYREPEDIRPMALKLAERPKCRRFVCLLIPLGILSAVLLLGMRFLAGPGTLGHSSSGSDDLSVYSTLTFPVSGLYCKSYSLTKYRGSATEALSWVTSIYILKEKPQLSSKHSFSIYRGNKNMITLKPGEFYQWSFTLYAGSSYEVNSCVWDGPEVDLYVIQGKANFRKWMDSQGNYDDTMKIPWCNQSIGKKYDLPKDSHSITTDDKYYFVYFSSLSPTAIHEADQESQVKVNMTFSKLEHSLSESNIHCYRKTDLTIWPTKNQFEYESCDIPLSFRGFVLIKTTPLSLDSNWEDKIHVAWSCNGSYNAYLLLFFLPIMLFYIVGLMCSDLPILIASCRKSHVNDEEKQTHTVKPDDPIPVCFKKPLLVLLWFLRVLLVFLGGLSVIFILLPLLLTALGSISKGIPGFSNNDLKLSLLAAGSILFIVAIFCNKFKDLVQKKVVALGKRLKIDDKFCTISTDTLSNFYVIIVCIFVVVTVSAVLTFVEGFYPVLRQYGSESKTGYDVYNPGDSREFSFNSFFCSEYSISSYGSPHLSASLYILGPSSLVQNRSISHITSNETISAGASATWDFYLNSNSFRNLSVCIYNHGRQSAVELLTIYPIYRKSRMYTRSNYTIANNCYVDGLQPIPIKEISKGKAGYYFIMLSTGNADSVNVHIEILLDRYEYSIESDIDVDSKQMCSTSSHTKETCTISAPSTAGSMSGLIVVESESDQSAINWHETLSIKKTCKYHWTTWTALWLPVFLINVICFSVVCGGFLIAKNKRAARKTAEDEQSETDKTETDSLLDKKTTKDYGTAAVTSELADSRSSHLESSEVVSISDHPLESSSVIVQVESDVEPNSTSSDSSHSVESQDQPSPTLNHEDDVTTSAINHDVNIENGNEHASLLQNAGDSNDKTSS